MANADFIWEKGMYFPWLEEVKAILKSPQPILAYHVASQSRIVGRQCDACGKTFERLPEEYWTCGIACIIEFLPDNKQRLLCMKCKPDLPWYEDVLYPKEADKPQPTEQQLSLWEGA